MVDDVRHAIAQLDVDHYARTLRDCEVRLDDNNLQFPVKQ